MCRVTDTSFLRVRFFRTVKESPRYNIQVIISKKSSLMTLGGPSEEDFGTSFLTSYYRSSVIQHCLDGSFRKVSWAQTPTSHLLEAPVDSQIVASGYRDVIHQPESFCCSTQTAHELRQKSVEICYDWEYFHPRTRWKGKWWSTLDRFEMMVMLLRFLNVSLPIHGSEKRRTEVSLILGDVKTSRDWKK